MFLPLFWAFYYGTPDWVAFAICIPLLGIPGFLLSRGKEQLTFGVRDSYLIVSVGWILSTLAGALPYVLSGVLSNPVDAVFEAMSGFTTTGATVMTQIEVPAAGILFWRSYLHWLGGMGIIVIFLAFLPKSRLGGSALFKAEVPGPEVERLTPRLRKTAALLWGIYASITVLQTVLLYSAGMSLYEALIHTFGTVATGGFSNRNLSVGAYANPWIRYIIMIFMLFSGVNFGLYHRAITTKSIKPIYQDKEFQVYLAIVLVATLVITANLSERLGILEALDHGAFQVVSVITTSGFMTMDFNKWPDLSRVVLLLLMFVGACSGSTGGSVKVVRYVVAFKGIVRELKRMIHAKAVLPIRIGPHVIHENTVRMVFVFLSLYMGCAMVGTLYMLFLGMDMISAFSAVATTLGNVGPGLGLVGPTSNFAAVPTSGKLLLTFLMLLGRLELFTVLVICTPSFWRKS
jgi:trk system potassium uptake protein TrkH